MRTLLYASLCALFLGALACEQQSTIRNPISPSSTSTGIFASVDGDCQSQSANPAFLVLNETTDHTTLQVSWQNVPGVTEYEVQIERYVDSAWAPEARFQVSALSVSYTGEGTFRVRVRTVYCGDRHGSWSPDEVKTVGTNDPGTVDSNNPTPTPIPPPPPEPPGTPPGPPSNNDHNNGHGNDNDHDDDSNPGRGRGGRGGRGH